MLPTEVRLVAELTRREETVATAESLTAGLVAATIASVPGASAVLRGGAVTYATDTKMAVLGVAEELLAEGGPVQAEVAEQMAVGARRVFGATYGVATTGVAGPDPQGDAPVGRVFIAVAAASGVRSRQLQLDGDRDRIRRATMHAVIVELLDELFAASWE
ncbi:CinA family protein [Yimella sp. cx-573]|nr:CinA family protein [Yimella sp. cx-573]